MMNSQHFRLCVIRPVLKAMDMWSLEAEALLLGTALHESGGLHYLRQIPSGPALGLYQMEGATLRDLQDNYLSFRPERQALLAGFKSDLLSDEENLRSNMAYQTAAARLQYYRMPEAIPRDLEGQASYWKKYWNSYDGKGTTEEYLKNYQRHYGIQYGRGFDPMDDYIKEEKRR